jgi:hypothetical protein
MEQIDAREYGERLGMTEVKAAFSVTENSYTDSEDSEETEPETSIQKHIYLLPGGNNYWVLDVYEVEGVAAEGIAERILSTLAYKPQLDRKGDGWVNVKLDMTSLKKQQETYKPSEKYPGYIKPAAVFLSKLKGSGIREEDIQVDIATSKYSYYLDQPVVNEDVTFMGSNDIAYVVNMIQPVIPGDQGIWAVSGYKKLHPEKAEALPALTMEQAKKDYVCYVYNSETKERFSYNAEKMQTFYDTQYDNTPASLDAFYLYLGTAQRTSWLHVDYDGSKYTCFNVYQTKDGKALCYNKREFNLLESTDSNGYTGYVLRNIDNATQKILDSVVLFLYLTE